MTNKNPYRMIRPWGVFKAQFKLFIRGLWAPSIIKMGRTVTYSETNGVGPLLTSVHYVQIGTESGEILYRSPHMTAKDRAEFVRRTEAIRDYYNRKNERGTYEF